MNTPPLITRRRSQLHTLGLALLRGSAFSFGVWAIDMLFVPYDRQRWFDSLPVQNSALADLILFALALRSVLVGVSSALHRATIRCATTQLLVEAFGLWSTFFLLYVFRYAATDVYALDHLRLAVSLVSYAGLTWSMGAVATFFLCRLVFALRRAQLDPLNEELQRRRLALFLVGVMALFSGRLQPPQDMLGSIGWLARIDPLRWELEGLSLTLDWHLGYALEGCRCRANPSLCNSADTGSFSGGTCFRPSLIGLRRPVPSAVRLLESEAGRRLAEASGYETMDPDEMARLFDDDLSRLTRLMGFCPDGQPFRHRWWPGFLADEMGELRLVSIWKTILRMDPTLAFYRGPRYEVWAWLLILMSTFGGVSAMVLRLPKRRTVAACDCM